jgi:hypothetical protein
MGSFVRKNSLNRKKEKRVSWWYVENLENLISLRSPVQKSLIPATNPYWFISGEF